MASAESFPGPGFGKTELLVVPDLTLYPPPSTGSLPGDSRVGLSPLGSRRPSSVYSSILDLSGDADQLDRAIREGDVVIVRRILQLHHGKFPLNLHASILDKWSCGARSRCNSQVSQDVEILLRKSQTLIDRYDRRESVATEPEVPVIFRTAIHQAIQHNSLEVLKVLLRYGIDPNEPSHNCRRDGGSPDCSFSLDAKGPLTLNNPQWSIDPPLEAPVNEISKQNARGIIPEKPFDLVPNYRANDLLNLPPLYGAVVAGRFQAVQLLLRYGALPNLRDNHGCSALHLAAVPEFYNRECAVLLLAHGAQVQLKNDSGVTPLDLCPSLLQEQRTLVGSILNGQPYPRAILPLLSEASHHGNHHTYSSNVSRFFKRLNSDSRVRCKDKKFRESGLGAEMRERAASAGSYRSLKGHRERPHQPTEDLDSVTSVVSTPLLLSHTFLSKQIPV